MMTEKRSRELYCAYPFIKDGNFELDHVAMGDVGVFCDRKLDAGTTIHSACQEPER